MYCWSNVSRPFMWGPTHKGLTPSLVHSRELTSDSELLSGANDGNFRQWHWTSQLHTFISLWFNTHQSYNLKAYCNITILRLWYFRVKCHLFNIRNDNSEKKHWLINFKSHNFQTTKFPILNCVSDQMRNPRIYCRILLLAHISSLQSLLRA